MAWLIIHFNLRELAAVFLRAQSYDMALAGKMNPNFMTITCAASDLFK